MKIAKQALVALSIMAILIAAGCGSNPSSSSGTASTADELDIAIRDASDYLNDNIPAGSKIVILNIQSDYPDLSDYIIDELLANAVADKIFSVVDRQQLDTIRSEQNFQWSGEVDDTSAMEIGKFFGAQTIVSGTISRLGTGYRIRIRALEVQTAQVQGQYNRNIAASPMITAITGDGDSGSSSSSASTSRRTATTSSGSTTRSTTTSGRGLTITGLSSYNNRYVYAMVRDNPDQTLSAFSSLSFYTWNPGRIRNGSVTLKVYKSLEVLDYYTGNDQGVTFMVYIVGKRKYDLTERFSSITAGTVEVNFANGRGSGELVPPPPLPSFRIGETGPAGGLIFYDKGRNTNGWRYLEAAPADLPRPLQAATENFDQTDCSERAVGKGKPNTDAIMRIAVTRGGGFGWAAQACDAFSLNGYDDWFLPSRDELHYMYGHLHTQGLGNFRSESYWTSTGDGNNWSGTGYYFWYESFSDGRQSTNGNNASYYVRPIRMVPGPL